MLSRIHERNSFALKLSGAFFLMMMISAPVISQTALTESSWQMSLRKGAHECNSPILAERNLLNAIRSRNLVRVRQLLRQKVNANAADNCQVSALTYAVAVDYPEIVRELLNAGAKVNAIDNFHGHPPLIWALKQTDEEERERITEIVRLLVEAGADVNLKGKSDQPALILAVLAGNEKAAVMLLNHNADVNARDDENRTAYSYAAEAGFSSLKKLLVARGADVQFGIKDYVDKFGEQAFLFAAGYGRTDIVEAMIADGFDVNYANEAGVTALMRVLEDSTLDVLLSAGADPNKKSKAGFTALMWAAISGRESVVRKLIAAGADVNAASNDGKTLLEHAAPEIKPILIRAGAKK